MAVNAGAHVDAFQPLSAGVLPSVAHIKSALPHCAPRRPPAGQRRHRGCRMGRRSKEKVRRRRRERCCNAASSVRWRTSAADSARLCALLHKTVLILDGARLLGPLHVSCAEGADGKGHLAAGQPNRATVAAAHRRPRSPCDRPAIVVRSWRGASMCRWTWRRPRRLWARGPRSWTSGAGGRPELAGSSTVPVGRRQARPPLPAAAALLPPLTAAAVRYRQDTRGVCGRPRPRRPEHPLDGADRRRAHTQP